MIHFLHDAQLSLALPDHWLERSTALGKWLFTDPTYGANGANGANPGGSTSLSLQVVNQDDVPPQTIEHIAQELTDTIVQQYPNSCIIRCNTTLLDDMDLCALRYSWRAQGDSDDWEHLKIVILQKHRPTVRIEADLVTTSALLDEQGPILQAIAQSLTTTTSAACYTGPDTRHFFIASTGLSILLPLSFIDIATEDLPTNAAATTPILAAAPCAAFSDLLDADETGAKHSTVVIIHATEVLDDPQSAIERFMQESLRVPRDQVRVCDEGHDSSGTWCTLSWALAEGNDAHRVIRHQHAFPFGNRMGIVTCLMDEGQSQQLVALRATCASIRWQDLSTNDSDADCLTLLSPDGQVCVLNTGVTTTMAIAASALSVAQDHDFMLSLSMTRQQDYGLHAFEDQIFHWRKALSEKNDFLQLSSEWRLHTVDMHRLYIAAYAACTATGTPLSEPRWQAFLATSEHLIELRLTHHLPMASLDHLTNYLTNFRICSAP